MVEIEVNRLFSEISVVENLYKTAFPEVERIPWKELLRLQDLMNLDFRAYYDNNMFIGFTIVYPRKTFDWFWYFAVKDELRGKGYGQQILSKLVSNLNGKSLVLDVESPKQDSNNREQRSRRYNFYLRNGFCDTNVGRSFEGVDFTILMYGDAIFTNSDYDDIIEELRKAWDKMPRPESSLHKVRITAVRQTIYPDLIAKYENPIKHTCDIFEGQQWISVNGERPEGLCPSAWESMQEFVKSLAQGKGNFFDDWMRNPMSAMISCNDGFRPFSFYIEQMSI